MACKTNTGEDILQIIEILKNDIGLLKRFVQGESDESVPLGEPIATPTPTLRHLAKNVLDAIDYFQSQIGEVLDPVRLDSYAFNVRRSRIMPEDVPAGSIVTLPVTYYPTRDILLVMYRGEVLTPRKQDDWNPGERQYDEIVGPDVPQGGNPANYPSNKIMISFDMEAGSNLDCWVVASNLMKTMGELLAARDVAVQAAETATEQAEIATQERETIQAMIGDAVLELGVANIDYAFRATQDYAPGDTMTFPAGLKYYPSRALLVMTYKGQVCTPFKVGQSNNYMYSEMGTDPTVAVNQVILHFDVKEGDPFYVMVWASSTGRNIEAIADLASEVKVAASNAVLAAQSVFNKADKYFATPPTFNAAPLRDQPVGEIISLLDFTNAGLPGGSLYSGRIDFSNGTYLSLDVDDNGKDRFSLKDAGDNVIQLFYVQDSGWAVTGRWQFQTPVTISTALSPDVPAGPCVWDSVLSLYATATPIDPQYNYLNKPERSELTTVFTNGSFVTASTSLTLQFVQYNAVTKTSSNLNQTVPIVSTSRPGIMPVEAYNALNQAVTDIEALKQQGGKYIGQGFETKAALDAFTIPASVNFGDFTYVEVDETWENATTRYICVDNGSGGKVFRFAYVIQEKPYGIADINTLGLVKSVAGNGPNGKVFVELDGTQSVLGWDMVTTAISNNVEKIAELEDRLDNVGGHIQKGTTAPTDLDAVWANTSDYCFYIHNGTKWVRMTGVYQENAGV